MNAAEQLREGPVPSQASPQEAVNEQVLHQVAQKPNPDPIVAQTGRGTWKSEVVMSGLEKALNALFKAQDHLNTAVDQGGDDFSKKINGINRNLKGLQQELSQVIYRLGRGG